MKHIMRIMFLIYIALTLTACKSEGITPFLYKEETASESVPSNNEADSLYYTIDNITLSKSYQSTNPSVEIIKDGLDANLLLTLGIIESTGVSIEKIEKEDMDVFIYIHNENKDSKGEIVVPQILLSLNNLSIQDVENLNYQIINQNYSPIKVSMDIGEAISKVESALKISASTFPNANIENKKNSLFLELEFINAVDLMNNKNPIINLNVLIDITNGKIVKSSKEPASTLIDEGNILEYIYNSYIFYVKEETILSDEDNSLWLYDIKNDTKKKIYSTKNKIRNICFNNDNKKLFIIESLEEYNELYILEFGKLKAYKVKLDRDIDPFMAIWKDNDNIILVDNNNNNSDIYNLNILSDNLDYIAHLDKNIKEIDFLDNTFLFALEDDKLKEIYTTENFKDITLIDQGSQATFIDNSKIAYIKYDALENTNNLNVYNLEDKSIDSYSDMDVNSFFKWKDTLAIIEENNIGSDNPLYIYNFENENIEFLTSIKSSKIFFNSNDNRLYINSSIEINEKKIPIISFIDLKP